MLLHEIIKLTPILEMESKVIKKDGRNIHVPDIEASLADDKTYGTKSHRITLNPEETSLFDHRSELVHSIVGHENISPETKKAISKISRPPEEVVSYYAFTLDKNPATADEAMRVAGLLSALKGRNTTEYMSPEDIDKFLDAAVNRLVDKAKTFGSRAPSKSSSDLAKMLYTIYNVYFAPFEKNPKTPPTGVVIVPLSSSASYVDTFANKLSKEINAPIVKAFIKSHWPVLSSWNVTTGTKKNPQYGTEFRVPSAYINTLKKTYKINDQIGQMIKRVVSGEGNIKEDTSTLRKMISAELGALVTQKEQLVKGFMGLIKEIPNKAQRQKDPRFDQYTMELRKIASRLKELPIPGYNVNMTWQGKSKQLQFVDQYLTALEDIAKAEESGEADDHVLKMLSWTENVSAQFQNAKDELIDYAVNNPFRVHDAYFNRDANMGKALSHYMMLRDELGDKLEGKNIILVDDNINSGQSINDAVKSIYFLGYSPKNIICVTPHLLKDGGQGRSNAAQEEIDAAKTEFNAREVANRPPRGEKPEHLEAIRAAAKFKQQQEKGTERVAKKASSL